MERKTYKIPKGKVLVFGDLHTTNRSRGRHKDYESESYEAMRVIEEKVRKEKPVAIVFLGDIIGYTDTVLKHGEFFTNVLKFFMHLNNVTNGRVFSVKGNHDLVPVTDYDTLEGLGLLKNPNYVDSENVRYHFINYGEEDEAIELSVSENIDGENEVANIIFGHNDYSIDDVTTWYQTDTPHPVSGMHNFKGVKMIVSGHIHHTSDDVMVTSIDGERVLVFYTGSMTRVAGNDAFDYSCYMIYDYEDGDNHIFYEIDTIDMCPLEDILYPKEEPKDKAEKVNEENIHEVVKYLAENNTSVIDVYEQIDRLPESMFTQRGKDFVKKIIQEQKNQA